MTISGVSGVSTQAGQLGLNQATDSYSKNIQNQIANAQKKLQELSSNEELSLEDKMKKKQEIQQEITNLNQQLRQHQIETRKQAQQKSGNSMEDMLGGNRKVQEKSGRAGTGMSSASMKAIISADASMGQVQVQSQVKGSLEGRAGVLKAEISQDGGRGWDTEAKEEELADIENKANNVTSSQMRALSDINKNLEEAVKEDNKADKTEDKKNNEEVKKTEENSANAEEGAAENAASATVVEEDAAEIVAAATTVTEEDAAGEASGITAGYTHVDLKL